MEAYRKGLRVWVIGAGGLVWKGRVTSSYCTARATYYRVKTEEAVGSRVYEAYDMFRNEADAYDESARRFEALAAMHRSRAIHLR